MANTRTGRIGQLSIAVAFAGIACAALAPAHAQTASDTRNASGALEEIVVTATRRAEPLSKVAVSVSAFGAEQMDERGVKTFDDLVRLSPGLNLTHQSATGANRISIRGIASQAGSGTTGVYIDDTPIQVRNLGFGAGNALPEMFDIERVEVLRGPQGTLFGAGSEGGNIRFITPEASLNKSNYYARAEVATLANGSPTYEAGFAVGGPIVTDKLGFRISASLRREGGYIDGVDGNYAIVDPTGSAYGKSVLFTRAATVAEDINWNRTTQLRTALKWQVSDVLTITPSVYYQKRYLNNGAGDLYDLATSDQSGRNYSRQVHVMAPAGTTYVLGTTPTTYTLNAMDAPNNAFGDDRFTLSAIALSWDLGNMQLFSNTSYFDRKSVQWYDYTKGYAEFYTPLWSDGNLGVEGAYPPLGWSAMALYNNAQGNLVQELRLQSKTGGTLDWVAGAFFSHNRQSASEPINENFLVNAPWVGYYPPDLGWGSVAFNDGVPFGPGYSAFQNFFGDVPLANAVSFFGRWKTVEQQVAAFAQTDWKFAATWKLTLGLRFSRNTLDFDAAYLGPENNARPPFGFDVCAPTLCTYGASGELPPTYPTSTTHSSESSTTPRVGLSWQPNDANLLYFTAAKGFRPAGASLRAPAICDGDLIDKGYVDANGNPVQPITFDSDSLWSFEIGSKNRLFAGRLTLDASVYHIKWKNIQTSVSLPNCSYNFVDNLANATSDGFDVAFEWRASEHLDFSGAFGYNNPKFSANATSPNGAVVIFAKDSTISDAGAPTTVSLSGEYHRSLGSVHRGYVRLDYTRTSEWRRTGETDPASVSYDPLRNPVPSYGLLNLRMGSRFTGYDVSFFVHNLTDAAPTLELSHSSFYDPQDWQNVTLRPRTYGLTLTWRK